MLHSDRRGFLKTAGLGSAAWIAASGLAHSDDSAEVDEPRFRVGIIGATGRGNYGHGFDTFWRNVAQAHVVAVADEDEEGRRQAAQRSRAASLYADYREMLDKERLDIVTIAPRWLDQHRDMCVAAAEHGCHILMEKPFCRDLTEADEMVRACEQARVKLAIGHTTRWSPTAHAAREQIQQGAIGKVLEIRARGKEDQRGGGEDLWVLGSHVLDLMRFFAGDPLSCRASVLNNGKPAVREDVIDGAEGIGPLTGDAIEASYALPDGVTGFFASHRRAAGSPSRFGVQIFGTEGVVEVLTGHNAECHILRDPSWSPGRSGKSWVRIRAADNGHAATEPAIRGNTLAALDLMECIADPSREPQCNLYDARWTVEMIAAVFESHRRQAPVELPLKNRQNPLSLL